MIGAQFELIAPAMVIGVVLVGAGYGVYRLARSMARKLRSFLWSSWRHIPGRSTRYTVGSDCHHREFVGRDYR